MFLRAMKIAHKLSFLSNVVSQLLQLRHLSCAPASLCSYRAVHGNHVIAGKQRRAELSGAQKGICISLYQMMVRKSNCSWASKSVYMHRHTWHTLHMSAVCPCQEIQQTDSCLPVQKRMFCVCPAFLYPY